jgi:hypothetical protein
VNAGKMMWNEIVKANWMRDSSRASESGFMGESVVGYWIVIARGLRFE